MSRSSTIATLARLGAAWDVLEPEKRPLKFRLIGKRSTIPSLQTVAAANKRTIRALLHGHGPTAMVTSIQIAIS